MWLSYELILTKVACSFFSRSVVLKNLVWILSRGKIYRILTPELMVLWSGSAFIYIYIYIPQINSKSHLHYIYTMYVKPKNVAKLKTTKASVGFFYQFLQELMQRKIILWYFLTFTLSVLKSKVFREKRSDLMKDFTSLCAKDQ